MLNVNTDFTSHHIEGIAREGNKPFNVPLVTEFDENLWQGGCIDGVNLGGCFKHIISLYRWERYIPGGELDSFLEVTMYDHGGLPDIEQLIFLADWVNKCRETGRTLVHCQAGLNRSGLVTGLALVRSGVPAKTAIEQMRERRCSAVLCNKLFEEWLLGQRTRQHDVV